MTHLARTLCLSFSFCLALTLVTGPAAAATCAEELPEIKTQIDAMPEDADKHVAETQYAKAEKRLEEGKERACLLYLESARSAIQAEHMSNR
ncbi:hypothetical protein [Roseobacter ponti]|uniref:DUF4398 domain-containing protein n=1 Tax=Roseobacter ponti TaxID=1891787 RepID=A0A858SN22_9RHOB|nr:hypothetical protein [Roseobacter ponti]QJF50214.1 hypothetical protein G3256_03035 [Roseobacter ponti]